MTRPLGLDDPVLGGDPPGLEPLLESSDRVCLIVAHVRRIFPLPLWLVVVVRRPTVVLMGAGCVVVHLWLASLGPVVGVVVGIVGQRPEDKVGAGLVVWPDLVHNIIWSRQRAGLLCKISRVEAPQKMV